MTPQQIAVLIDESPMNRGMRGETWLSDPSNRAVVKGETVMLFALGPAQTSFEFHWLKAGRNAAKTIRDTREAMWEVLRPNPFCVIYGLIPVERRDSKFMARKVGAQPHHIFPTPNGNCQLFTITKEILEGIV